MIYRSLRITCVAFVFAVAALSSSSSLADGATVLRFDPFRPLPQDVRASADDTRRNSPAVFEPSLRSIVVAGKKSLANLGGEIIGLGEEKKGYRLIEIHPFEAVFERDGQEVRIQLERSAGEGR